MKPISGSQNLTIILSSLKEIRLLRNRDETSQTRPMPTIRNYLQPRYHANIYTYSNYCELYVAL